MYWFGERLFGPPGVLPLYGNLLINSFQVERRKGNLILYKEYTKALMRQTDMDKKIGGMNAGDGDEPVYTTANRIVTPCIGSLEVNQAYVQ